MPTLLTLLASLLRSAFCVRLSIFAVTVSQYYVKGPKRQLINRLEKFTEAILLRILCMETRVSEGRDVGLVNNQQLLSLQAEQGEKTLNKGGIRKSSIQSSKSHFIKMELHLDVAMALSENFRSLLEDLNQLFCQQQTLPGLFTISSDYSIH